MQVTAHGTTHRGLVRPGNEDSFYCGRRVLAVADGLGGHAAGEIASALAIGPLEALDGREYACADLAAALAAAVREGNAAVYRDAEAHPDHHGMGTTVTAAVVCDGRAHLAHVGDSRAYLLRPGGDLRQLTTDHGPVAEAVAAGLLTPEQAAVHPERSLLSRVVGLEPDVTVDVYDPVGLGAGDRLLLCSDGLTEALAEADIARILAADEDPAGVCDALVDATLAAGAPDNVTVVVAVVGA
jgi:PPM family protein phosphatase